MTEAMSKGDGDGNRGETETPKAHPESARCLFPVPAWGSCVSVFILCPAAGLSSLLSHFPAQGWLPASVGLLVLLL